MKHKNFFQNIKSWTAKHKTWTLILVIIILGLAWYTYGKVAGRSGETQYVVVPTRIGTLVQTVTGSGQVAAENQLDIKSEVSGTILSINAKVGQTVKRGDLIATIDSHDASVDLENARIALAKLTEPAKPGDIVNSENSVTKAYTDGFNAVADSFLDGPLVMSGLKDLLYASDGYLSDQRSTSLTQTGQVYRKTAGTSYDKANDDFTAVLLKYRAMSRASATTSIESIIKDTYDVMKEISEALKNSQSAITFIASSQPDYYASAEPVAASNVSTWSSQVNGHISSLLAAKSSIQSSVDSLARLREGAEALDIRSQKLAVSQKERTYSKYFIRAPFDGVIGRIPVNTYDEASAGTIIATVISNRQITTIPLNEIDATKVQANNPAILTFDAVEGLALKGTVAQVDLVGTASQGVVTYNIKIIFDSADTRVRPGMSVDAAITTEEKSGVLLVPSSAVKTQGKRSYVEILDSVPQASASSTRRLASTTGQLTVASPTLPRQAIVTVGDSNDTDTEILNGLNAGQFVVVRTIAGGTATAAKTTAPNLLGSFGGNQRAGAGATRTVGR